ncbi:unnamed protein product [Triticum turgidum subsp. durum]|uniref:Uncharacterized protein n=1 Tax=Triticum turgidum subsp. durum TaxID=4567 RepID=A0A9R0QAK7_TRITD|nr:unnamed protein product [Triticum turgidum subsp. durum]
MLGLFGVLISLFAGYGIAGFMFYTITPFVLKSPFEYFSINNRCNQQINWLYYLAFTVVAIGLIIYSLNENSSADATAASTEAAAHYQQLPSEDNSTGSGSNLDRKERKQQEAHIC